MFREIKPQQLQENPFTMIGKDWLLITAGDKNKCNTMTASWGGVGVLWNQDVCTVYIRPQRYTKEFVDREKEFSICVMDASFRDALNLCGTKSGRDMDKIGACGFTVDYEGDTPYFDEARVVIVCEKLYAQELKPEHFLVPGYDERYYPDKDYHTMYVGRIKKVLVK
ncbi:flavin reductase family protein [Zongyangia hominis]